MPPTLFVKTNQKKCAGNKKVGVPTEALSSIFDVLL